MYPLTLPNSNNNIFTSKRVDHITSLPLQQKNSHSVDTKIVNEVLQLVDQIKAKTAENVDIHDKNKQDLSQQDAEEETVALRSSYTPFEVLKEFLSKKKESPKYVVQANIDNIIPISNVNEVQPMGSTKCLQMLLNPNFKGNMGVFKQNSGSTNSDSAKNEEGAAINRPLKIFDHQNESTKFFRPIFSIKQAQKEETEDNSAAKQLEQIQQNDIPKQNDEGFKLPIFRPDIDYEYLYMRLFQDNEKKLQQYDTLIQEKERLLKIYKVMKTGEIHQANSELIQSYQEAQDIFKTLIPQLVDQRIDDSNTYEDYDQEIAEDTSFKRRKINPQGDFLSVRKLSEEITGQKPQVKNTQSSNRQIEQDQYSKISEISVKQKAVSQNPDQSEMSESMSQSYVPTNENGEKLNQINKIISSYDMNMQKRENQRKKHVRRCAKELKKEFQCLYNCGKEYATDAARNMHMREKHNEVTKTERDRKARDIIQKCGLKNNNEIVSKLSLLTKQQQKQLQSELLLQTQLPNQTKTEGQLGQN